MIDLLYCPRCGLTGDELGQCGSSPGIPCPEFQPVDFASVVLLSCTACPRQRAITVDDIMHGRTKQHTSGCQRTVCEAHVLAPKPATVTVTRDVEVIKEVPAALDVDTVKAFITANPEAFPPIATVSFDPPSPDAEPARKAKATKPAPVPADDDGA